MPLNTEGKRFSPLVPEPSPGALRAGLNMELLNALNTSPSPPSHHRRSPAARSQSLPEPTGEDLEAGDQGPCPQTRLWQRMHPASTSTTPRPGAAMELIVFELEDWAGISNDGDEKRINGANAEVGHGQTPLLTPLEMSICHDAPLTLENSSYPPQGAALTPFRWEGIEDEGFSQLALHPLGWERGSSLRRFSEDKSSTSQAFLASSSAPSPPAPGAEGIPDLEQSVHSISRAGAQPLPEPVRLFFQDRTRRRIVGAEYTEDKPHVEQGVHSRSGAQQCHSSSSPGSTSAPSPPAPGAEGTPDLEQSVHSISDEYSGVQPLPEPVRLFSEDGTRRRIVGDDYADGVAELRKQVMLMLTD